MAWRVNVTGTVAQCQTAVNAITGSGTASETAQVARAITYLLAEIAVFASAAKLNVNAEGAITNQSDGWGYMRTRVQPYFFVSPSGDPHTELRPAPAPS
jgi:hypothetical protein